jgi:hypothetical protein
VKINAGIIITKTRVGQMLEAIKQFVTAAFAKTKTAADMAAECERNVEILVANRIVRV